MICLILSFSQGIVLLEITGTGFICLKYYIIWELLTFGPVILCKYMKFLPRGSSTKTSFSAASYNIL